jgi:hypothetical protein
MADNDTASTKNPWAHRLLAIAAGVVLGYGILWAATSIRRAAGLSLIDHGRAFTIHSDGTVTGLGPIPADLQPTVRDAVLLDKIEPPSFWSGLRRGGKSVAGPAAAANSFRAIAPVGAVVQSNRPVFQWSSRPGATSYRVTLTNTASAITSSPLLSGAATSWQPNDPLTPNETYSWRVEAWRDGTLIAKAPTPPAPEALFRVLEPATRAALERLRETSGGAHLLMGLGYAHAGLQAEAQRELEAFGKENSRSPLPKNLLSSLASW